ncbi:MlaD family protein [Iodobacter fluviatilis]|uniref:Virulence factor Mce family protein n=1 Tax=Iodobacter fluviatilis TaxID=537 RepID=A0A377Q904_9NEIS|nr:MlaD family protein [Iodobacter fluviatilis]TCU88878.1 virulence factor Mce-like protein [Iodobacter fluviatilis]STQ91049.1 virulence factor Mce family protein [Iodobacter fluviatilis]
MSVDSHANPLKKDKRTQVGLFVAGGVFFMAVALFVLARSLGWFEQSYTLEFHAASAESLNKGMLVRLSGLPVGKVTGIKLEDDARVRVQLQINKDFQRWIKSDSAASLAREGIFGDSFIQITAGKDKGASLESGAVLVFDPGSGMNELLQQLRERLFPLLEEMQSLAASLKAPDGQLGSTLGEARALLHELRNTRVQIDKTLASAALLTHKNIPDTLGYVDGTLAGFKKTAQSTDEQLAQISGKLQDTLDQYERTGNTADQTLKEVQTLVKETRPLLQKAIKDADVVMRSANQTMTNMNDHWPFSGDAKPASMAGEAPAE